MAEVVETGSLSGRAEDFFAAGVTVLRAIVQGVTRKGKNVSENQCQQTNFKYR